MDYKYKAWTPTAKLLREFSNIRKEHNKLVTVRKIDLGELQKKQENLKKELDVIESKIGLANSMYNRRVNDIINKKEEWFIKCGTLMSKRGFMTREELESVAFYYDEKKLEIQLKTEQENQRDIGAITPVQQIIIIDRNTLPPEVQKELQRLTVMLRNYKHGGDRLHFKRDLKLYLLRNGFSESLINKVMNKIDSLGDFIT
jgi:hypothetical protein